MLPRLRLQLTVLYAGAALLLLVSSGTGVYWIIARYFADVTDLALAHQMAHEFHALRAPIPAALLAADRDWSTLRDGPTVVPPRSDGAEDQEEDDDDEGGGLILDQPADAAELAAIAVVMLDGAGRIVFAPDAEAGAAAPYADQDAFLAARADGHDLRTVTLADGGQMRLLTYRFDHPGGPAALQLGRPLRDQQRVLERLALGLVTIGTSGMLLVGLASWGLAGRAIRPAEQAWQRQQRFIASASHELRTPLTLIRASAEVARRSTAPGDEEQRQLYDDIIGESDHMRRLVDDLLLLSRIDAGALPWTPGPVELAPLCSEVARQMARLAAERGVTVRTGACEGVVQADRERLRQVLLILLDNAVRHTPAGGHITLGSSVRPGHAVISVSDTGVGIAAEHLPRIFEAFYRVDAARQRDVGNAGLGLAIAAGIVAAMQGTIEVDSAPGVGTRFSITLRRGGATAG
ncbi:MAG: histidine kinase [Chloroflexi bacterium]|nr:histidine kinase [Chloroflexota bacterium]